MSNLLDHIDDRDLRLIADKITGNIRITPEEGLLLFTKADLSMLGLLAFDKKSSVPRAARMAPPPTERGIAESSWRAISNLVRVDVAPQRGELGPVDVP